MINIQYYQGDSGAPLWMYHMGRAYQIGIDTGGFRHIEDDGCRVPYIAVYLPLYMDWVLDVIKNN